MPRAACNTCAHYYDPGTAQFLTRDPIDILGPYAYAFNNPLAFHDPSGLSPLDDVGNFMVTCHIVAVRRC